MWKDQAIIVIGKVCLIVYPGFLVLSYAITHYFLPVYYQLANVLQVK